MNLIPHRQPLTQAETATYVIFAIAVALDQPGCDVLKVVRDFSEDHTQYEIEHIAVTLLTESLRHGGTCVDVLARDPGFMASIWW
jgi:hypothetical protein